MKVSFHPEAKEEFFKAINYYEECQEGLGLELAKEIYSITVMQLNREPGYWKKR